MDEVLENMSTGEKAGQDFLRLMHTSSGRASDDRAGAREREREEGEEQAEHGASHVENGKMDHGIMTGSPARTPADYSHTSALLSRARCVCARICVCARACVCVHVCARVSLCALIATVVFNWKLLETGLDQTQKRI